VIVAENQNTSDDTENEGDEKDNHFN
jgi:hypothetical protein